MESDISQRLTCIAAAATDTSEVQQSLTIAELFQHAVTNYWDQPALSDELQSLTYGELSLKVQKIADVIALKVPDREAVVGIMMRRTCDAIATVLGVVSAGRPYLLIDPAYPASRVDVMLKGCNCGYLITEKTLASAVPPSFGGHTLFAEDVAVGEAPQRQAQAADARDLLYIIYTSGSTGVPKGVAVENRSVANMALSYIHRLQITADDRITQFSSLSFAASVIEVYVTLLSGAHLVIVPDNVKLNATRFAEFIKQRALTVALLPPNYAAELTPSKIPLRVLITAGAPTTWNIVSHWAGHVAYYNVYGCSETATGVSAYRAGEGRTGVNVPIGSPNSATQFFLLTSGDEDEADENQRGELCVGGVCLARGYYGNEKLTAEKFICTVDADGLPIRLYRTGDIARVQNSGDIEIVGRVDDQISINGYRVEPAEVNAHVARHPDVQDSVVLARTVRGKQVLAAYCVTGTKNLAADLVDYLLKHLPDYMVPRHIVPVDSIPLNINGKVDKQALPDPLDAFKLSEQRTPARNDIERLLVDVWANTLDMPVEKVGIDDNFFHLGGDSISAIQIVSRLYERGYQADIGDLMLCATIRAYAGKVIPVQDSGGEMEFTTVEAVSDLTQRQVIKSVREHHNKVNLSLQEGARVLKRYPLSHMQAGLYLSYLQHGGSQYIVHNVFDVRGALDPARFARCLQAVMQRHEVLRSVITHLGADQPYQVVLSSFPLRLRYTDMSSIGHRGALEEVKEWVEADRRRPFFLECENAVRFHVIKWAENHHSVIVCYHHIILDGWCMNVLWSELQALYSSQTDPFEVPLAPAVPYSAYIDWLNKHQSVASEVYWQSYLKNYFPTTVCSEPPAGVELKYCVDHFELPSNLTCRIKEFARYHQLTLSSVMKACWGLTLCANLKVRDIVFGEVLAGRPPHLPGSADTLGLFVNTVPARVSCDEAEAFLQLADRVQRASIESQQHQYLPLSKIQMLSGHGSRLIDHIFVFENYPPLASNDKSGTGLDVDLVFDLDEVNYNLNMSVSVTDTVNVRVLYRYPVFSAEHVEAIFRRFAETLSWVIERPERSLGMLLSGESKDVQPSVLAGSMVARPSTSIARLLADSAASHAERIAVRQPCSAEQPPPVFGYELTYRQLDDHASQLAVHLRLQGIAAGDTVAIYLPRSTDYIVSILATLKIGATYMPLDPASPEKRNATVLSIADPDVVIYDGRDRPDWFLERREIDLSASISAIRECVTVGVCAVDCWSPAQILFTSGTTGTPKGVRITHQGLINHALSVKDKLSLAPEDSVLQFSNLGFDAFGEELFPTLLAGATLVLRTDDVLNSYHALADTIHRNSISVVDLPTAYWNHWVDSLRDDASAICMLQTMKFIIVGGEEISVSHVKQWQGLLPTVPVINTYGPTECTIICSWFEIPPLAQDEERIPIGRPLPNTTLYVSDEAGRAVARGNVGELHVAGVGVADGYINASASATRKFFEQSLEGELPRSVYATGDFVYVAPEDGNLYYVGRKDSLVKIRGYQVDLSEVRTIVEANPSVRRAYAKVDVQETGKTVLVFIQVDDGALREDIERWAKDVLPAEARPLRIVFVNQWPLNAHGKVDLNQLSAEPNRKFEAENPLTSQTQTQTQTQKSVQNVWQEVLGTFVTDLDASFFEVGGHSLHAISMLTRIQRTLGVKLGVDVLFKQPSIRALAKYIDESQSAETLGAVELAGRVDGVQPLFLFPPVGGDLLCYREIAEKLADNYRVYGCKSHSASSGSFTEVAQQYVDQILQVQSDGPYLLGGWSMGGALAQEVACILEEQGRTVDHVLMFDAWHPSALPFADASDTAMIDAFCSDFVLSGRAAEGARASLSKKTLAGGLQTVWRALMLHGGIDEDFDYASFCHAFNRYKCNSESYLNHVPRYFGGRTVLFRAAKPLPDMTAPPAALGWENSVAQLQVIDNAMDHYHQLKGEVLEVIAAELARLSVASRVDGTSEAINEL